MLQSDIESGIRDRRSQIQRVLLTASSLNDPF